jgi:MFS family permease
VNPIIHPIFMDGSNRTATNANNPAPPRRPARSVAWIIAASSFAFAVIQLDVTIVNVALSRISADFGATMAGLQWVVDAYTLGFAALLLSAGVVADRLGSKRVFVAGLVGFAAASLACGLAPSPGFLNATRAIQGIGAALLVPSSLAILNAACIHDPRLRARAIGIWTAAGGVAIAAGPVVGGLLLTRLGWRSIFLVNIPICVFGLGLTLRYVPTTQITETKHRSFDLAGQALAIVVLTALIGAVIEARPLGLTQPIVVAGGLLALGAGAAFIASRRELHPRCYRWAFSGYPGLRRQLFLECWSTVPITESFLLSVSIFRVPWVFQRSKPGSLSSPSPARSSLRTLLVAGWPDGWVRVRQWSSAGSSAPWDTRCSMDWGASRHSLKCCQVSY